MSEYLKLLKKAKEKEKPKEKSKREVIIFHKEQDIKSLPKIHKKIKSKPRKIKPKEEPKMYLTGKGAKKLISELERFDFENMTIDTLRGVKFIIIGKTDKESDKTQISKEIKKYLSKPEYLGQLLEYIAIFLKSVP